jgi:tetratricopeptide (TPR) repeat protein
MKPWPLPALLLLATLCLRIPAARCATDPALADSLARQATALLQLGTAESRARAMRMFERATEIEGNRSDLWLAFGHACRTLGRHERARACFERATSIAPGDAAAWFALGESWKDDWLAHLDRASLERARKSFERASTLAPQNAWPLTALAAVALLKGDPRSALASALHANAADPDAPEPMMALGSALFRLGALAYADSAFREAQRRVPPELAVRIADSEFAWADSDPDLTTPENEARLDYLTRVALVFFLFTDDGVLHWDKRAELFVRYGPPANVEFNPAAAQLGLGNDLEFHYAPDAVRPYYAPPPIGFPFDMQVWHYPDLGMDVELWDRSLTGEYELPYTKFGDLDPRPDPVLLAERTDLVALGDGVGVFHAGAPGARPLPMQAAFARFPLGNGVQLLGNVLTDAAPSDSLWATWALADTTGNVVVRSTCRLAQSTCEPARRQVGSFQASVPAGDYRVDFAVWDGHGRRGVQHLRAHAGEPVFGPLLSDLVLLCEGSPLTAQPDAVRLEPDLDGHFAGSQLTVYFEIDNLLASPGRPAQFSYRSQVFALDPRRRKRPPAGPLYDATRMEENAGAHRRQFVTAPIRELGPGEYELVVEVTDLSNGQLTRRTARFTKEGRRKA